ncbi:MAG: Na+/H+ antiporter subunit E [candidate division KSB1 bacterium]|nr:Na+/H+ antiporter subunit E [candidate division KSB1 bacterium]
MITKLVVKFIRIIGFLIFYIREVILANFRIAYDIISPRYRIKPGIIAIPLKATTDWELLMLNNLLTMTPGTLSLDISTDRRVIYIHAMYVTDPEQIRLEFKSGIEKKILEVSR